MKHLKTYETNKGITFKEWLKKRPIDLNATIISCKNSNLIDLNGIEEFENLEFLSCTQNKLTELPDLSSLTNLRELYCYSNQLVELPDLSNLKNLRGLFCFNNNLPFKCSSYINNLDEYKEWHKKEYPWIYDEKKI
jgi:Leucine-rich repeat (LRR) protein